MVAGVSVETMKKIIRRTETIKNPRTSKNLLVEDSPENTYMQTLLQK